MDRRTEAQRTALKVLFTIFVLLAGSAAYLFSAETGSRRDDGYATVVAVHLTLLAVGCLGVAAAIVRRWRRGRHLRKVVDNAPPRADPYGSVTGTTAGRPPS